MPTDTPTPDPTTVITQAITGTQVLLSNGSNAMDLLVAIALAVGCSLVFVVFAVGLGSLPLSARR